MLTSTVPGELNLDKVDPSLQEFEHLLQTNKTLRLSRVFANVSATSFSFGQAGGQHMVRAPSIAVACKIEAAASPIRR